MRRSISAFWKSQPQPMLRAPVPMTIAERTRSGWSIATCWTIALPKEMPTSDTGGSQTCSMSAVVSSLNFSSGHGIGSSHVVCPMPRLSKVVLRKCGSKKGIWYLCQSLPRLPPPETHTTS